LLNDARSGLSLSPTPWGNVGEPQRRIQGKEGSVPKRLLASPLLGEEIREVKG